MMEALEMKDMKIGWWGLFDALYGPEEVLEITTYALGPNQRGAKVIGTSNESGTWEVVRFRVSDGRGENPHGRYIIRFLQEPLMAMTYPHASDEVRVVSRTETEMVLERPLR